MIFAVSDVRRQYITLLSKLESFSWQWDSWKQEARRSTAEAINTPHNVHSNHLEPVSNGNASTGLHHNIDIYINVYGLQAPDIVLQMEDATKDLKCRRW